MSDDTRIVLLVSAGVVALMAIASAGVRYLSGNTPIILMVIATVVAAMAIALAGVYFLNKAVKD
jgi:hypothetical protein